MAEEQQTATTVGRGNERSVPAWLGVSKPGFFVEVEDVDDNGRPLINLRTLGGLTEEAAVDLMRWIVGELSD